MMIIMRTDATQEQIDLVVKQVEVNGLRVHLSTGTERTVIGAIGDGRPVLRDQFMFLPGVDRVVPDLASVQISVARVYPGKLSIPHRWSDCRRGRADTGRRSLLG